MKANIGSFFQWGITDINLTAGILTESHHYLNLLLMSEILQAF